eukprot:12633863-Ditylum_brightwellii.AAC.1
MANQAALSKKIKVESGMKTNKNGCRTRLVKKNFRRPTICHEKFEGKTLKPKGYIFDTGHGAHARCQMPDDIEWAIKNLEAPYFLQALMELIKLEHGNKDGNPDMSIANIYLTKQIDVYLQQKDIYNDNKSKMFTIIIGQCLDLVISKLETEAK